MNPTFKDKPWNQRITRLGDEAETVFENWANQQNIGFHRSGINRPPFKVGRLPKMVSYTPDYLTENGYIEVQGFGRDGQIKLKYDKLDALSRWDMIFKTEMFLWDNVAESIAIVPVNWFLRTTCVSTGTYPEGKEYGVWDPKAIREWMKYVP